MTQPEDILWFGDPAEAEHPPLGTTGDLWHSGLVRGTAGQLSELKYWSPVYWWFINDPPTDLRCVSWRVDASAFAVRASAWQAIGGLDAVFESAAAQGLDLGFRLLRRGGVPVHQPGLFPAQPKATTPVPPADVYRFFARHFKRTYGRYLWLRRSLATGRPWREWQWLRQAERDVATTPAPANQDLPPRPLAPLPDAPPRVSAVIPTMRRPDYTAQLIEDFANQTVPLKEIVVVDATPEADRDLALYARASEGRPVRIHWQTSEGSCRARNEAIADTTGDYILFADDDTRVPPDYVEKHLRLLLTYDAEAANGRDIRADHHRQDLEDLARKHAAMPITKVGIDTKYNNANSFVRRDWVERLGGNDAAFDGGYGEDRDFGHRLLHNGAVLLHNPYATNLHLKPPAGGYRWWAKQIGNRQRRKPWEFARRMGWIRPRPSPTVMYGFLKQFRPEQLREWRWLYLLRAWWPSYSKPHESRFGRLLRLPGRLLATPWRLLQMRESRRFAQDLIDRGPIHE